MSAFFAGLLGLFRYAAEIRWLIQLLNQADPAARQALKEAIEAEAKEYSKQDGRPKW